MVSRLDLCPVYVCTSIMGTLQSVNVRVDKYVWLVEMSLQKDEWKFVSIGHGVEFVAMYGVTQMLKLSADNLDTLISVSHFKCGCIRFFIPCLSIVFERVRDGLSYLRTTPIHLDNVHCTGDEESLFQCRHNGVGIHDCRGTDGASAICYIGRNMHMMIAMGCGVLAMKGTVKRV